MTERHYCPECGAGIEEQEGFEPDSGLWKCTKCGLEMITGDICGGEESREYRLRMQRL